MKKLIKRIYRKVRNTVLLDFFLWKSKARGYKLITLGADNYGSWTIPDNILNKDSICYCAGAGQDISFDIGLVNRYGCNVYIFDPTPIAIEHFTKLKETVGRGEKMMIRNNDKLYYNINPDHLSLIEFYNWGVYHRNENKLFYNHPNPNAISHSITNIGNTKNGFNAECKTIKSIMRSLRHDKLDLLKIDIEGAEYDVFKSIWQDGLNINIICVELHFPKGQEYRLRARTIKETIREIDNNGYWLIQAKNGTDFTFIKK